MSGSFQIRPAGTNLVRYAPDRDFVYCYPAMFESAKRAIENDYWPDFWPACESLYQLSPVEGRDFHAELLRTVESYAEFLRRLCEIPEENVDQLLVRVGWHGCHVAARLLWSAMLGAVVAGQIFVALRDITPMGGKSDGGVDELLEQFGRARTAANARPWSADRALEFKKMTRQCVAAGLTFEDVQTLVNDVRLGR